MKKFLCLLTAVALLLSLAACTQTGTETTSQPPTETTDAPVEQTTVSPETTAPAADVNLYYLLYSHMLEEPTQEEQDSWGDLQGALFKYPVSAIDEVLNTHFGIRFSECSGIGLEKMVYDPNSDSYFHEHGDLSVSMHTIFDGYVNPDGTVELYYYSGNFIPEEERVPMTVTLKYAPSMASLTGRSCPTSEQRSERKKSPRLCVGI